jgi:hypothetical protein
MFKKIICALSFALGALGPLQPCYADGHTKGTIEYIRLLNDTVYPGWGSQRFWFSLHGITSLGSCGLAYDRPILIGEGKDAYAMVLSAYLTGKEVAVLWSDSAKYGSYCRAGGITMGDPPLTQ